MPDELRADAILNTLAENGVAFVLIGGLALGAHGVVRGTKDVDIVPDPDRPNLERLSRPRAGFTWMCVAEISRPS